MIKGVIFYEVIQLLSDLFITRNNLTPILISNTSLVSGYEGVNAMFCDFILNFAWNDFGMRDILWLSTETEHPKYGRYGLESNQIEFALKPKVIQTCFESKRMKGKKSHNFM